jgi:hypothetical protein
MEAGAREACARKAGARAEAGVTIADARDSRLERDCGGVTACPDEMGGSGAIDGMSVSA